LPRPALTLVFTFMILSPLLWRDGRGRGHATAAAPRLCSSVVITNAGQTPLGSQCGQPGTTRGSRLMSAAVPPPTCLALPVADVAHGVGPCPTCGERPESTRPARYPANSSAPIGWVA